jgi:hypothetical protein
VIDAKHLPGGVRLTQAIEGVVIHGRFLSCADSGVEN